MSEPEWHLLVHGRTRFVDFPDDLIAAPAAFSPDDLAWAKQFVNATTDNGRGLHEGPRWVMFKSRGCCVFGTACMASEVSADEIFDQYGRPVYVFLGYVCLVDRQRHPVSPYHAPIPPLVHLCRPGLELMRPAFRPIGSVGRVASSIFRHFECSPNPSHGRL